MSFRNDLKDSSSENEPKDISIRNKLKSWLVGLRKPGSLNRNKWWAIFIFASVPLLMIVAIASEWDTLANFEWQINWGFLIAMVILHSLAQGALLGAWYYALRILTGQGQFLLDLRIFNLSILARRIPLPIWYIGSRLHLYQQAGVSTSAVITATGLELVLITISGLVCFILLLPWYTFAQNWPWQIIVSGASILTLALMIRPGLLVELINRVLKRLKRPEIPATINRIDLLICGGFYLMTWFLDGLGLYFMVAALVPNPPPLPSVIGVSTVTALVAILSMAIPGGFGLKEITMSALLSLWMPLSAGLVISIVYRFAQTFVEVFWAFFSNQAYKKRPNPPV